MGLRLPLRSLLRNRRRTLLSVSIVALGTALSLFVLGFFGDSKASIKESQVQQFGNLQLATEAFWDESEDNEALLLDPETLRQAVAIAAAHPEVASTTVQLTLSGLIAAGTDTRAVSALGYVPGNEALDYGELVVSGNALQAGDVGGVVLGQSLADQMVLEVGDIVTLTTTTSSGAFNALPVRIVGIFRFSSEQVESRQVFVPLALAQSLRATRGVDRIVVKLRDQDLAATAFIRNELDGELAAAGLSVRGQTWEELSVFYEQLIGFFDTIFGFVALALSVLVFFIILQVLTLSFLERTREFGTVRALGTKRNELFRLLLLEGGVLAVIGSLAGVILGVGLAAVFNAVGISWQPPGTVEPVTLSIRLTGSTVWLPLLISITATVLSALYPAARASRMQVVDALRVT